MKRPYIAALAALALGASEAQAGELTGNVPLPSVEYVERDLSDIKDRVSGPSTINSHLFIYQGGLHNGEFSVVGDFLSKKDGISFRGGFSDNRPDGLGILTRNDVDHIVIFKDGAALYEDNGEWLEVSYNGNYGFDVNDAYSLRQATKPTLADVQSFVSGADLSVLTPPVQAVQPNAVILPDGDATKDDLDRVLKVIEEPEAAPAPEAVPAPVVVPPVVVPPVVIPPVDSGGNDIWDQLFPPDEESEVEPDHEGAITRPPAVEKLPDAAPKEEVKLPNVGGGDTVMDDSAEVKPTKVERRPVIEPFTPEPVEEDPDEHQGTAERSLDDVLKDIEEAKPEPTPEPEEEPTPEPAPEADPEPEEEPAVADVDTEVVEDVEDVVEPEPEVIIPLPESGLAPLRSAMFPDMDFPEGTYVLIKEKAKGLGVHVLEGDYGIREMFLKGDVRKGKPSKVRGVGETIIYGTSQYFGEHNNKGLMHGRGIFKELSEDGFTCDGSWVNGKPFGPAIFSNGKGISVDVEFDEEGKAIFEMDNGRSYQIIWEDFVFVVEDYVAPVIVDAGEDLEDSPAEEEGAEDGAAEAEPEAEAEVAEAEPEALPESLLNPLRSNRYPDMDFAEGEYLLADKKFTGLGVSEMDNLFQRGEMYKGKMHGVGEIILYGSFRYFGEYSQDVMEGRGIFEELANDGYMYDGDWSEGQPFGPGSLFDKGLGRSFEVTFDLEGRAVFFVKKIMEGDVEGWKRITWNDYVFETEDWHDPDEDVEVIENGADTIEESDIPDDGLEGTIFGGIPVNFDELDGTENSEEEEDPDDFPVGVPEEEDLGDEEQTDEEATEEISEEEGEYLRLRNGLRDKMDRAFPSWAGAENDYARIVELNDDGDIEMTYEDYLFGFKIAKNLGDVASVQARIELALEEVPDDQVDGLTAELDFIEQNYGQVEITLHKKFEGEVLIPQGPPPFGTETALAFAQAELLKNAEFEGYVPVGTYLVGDNIVDVAANGEVFVLKKAR